MAWVPISGAPPYFHFTHLPPLLTTCPGRPTRKCPQTVFKNAPEKFPPKYIPNFPQKLQRIYFNLSTPPPFLLLGQKAKLISAVFLHQCLLLLMVLPTQGFLSISKKLENQTGKVPFTSLTEQRPFHSFRPNESNSSVHSI